MSGLNFLLWTIGVLIILGVIGFVGACIYGYRQRDKMVDEYNKHSRSLRSRLEEAKRKQEELIKQQNKQ